MSASPEWAPQRVVTPTMAARVIAAQFPELAGQPVRAFDAGWDNVVLAVGDDWLFRFVHREIALPGARRELAVLRHLDDRFSLPIPRPRFVGTPTEELGWPFWGARRLPGRELGVTGLPEEARTAAGAALGGFLRELHDPRLARLTADAVEASGVPLPVDPLRRGDARSVAGRARQRLDRLAAHGVRLPGASTDELLAAADVTGAPAGEPVLVHGDLHVRHVLVDDGGRATGVIDWGDTTLGDPAVDLMIGYAAFSGSARRAFLHAYGPVDTDRETRARVLALYVSAVLAEYSAVEGLHDLHREAVTAMGRALR